MVFSSPLFLFAFLPAVLIVYYLVPLRFKNVVLVLSSLLFYFWGEQIYTIIMLISTVIDYTHGQIVSHYKDRGRDDLARLGVFSSVFFNLALLIFFKYADFLTGILNIVLTGFGMQALPLPGIHLPIGISFYTFQTMSYTIDVYRGEAKAQKSFLNFSVFVTLFPQLIAGPIVKYRELDQELDARARCNRVHAGPLDTNAIVQVNGADLFAYGITRFICGLFKKACLANSIGLLWDTISGMQAQNLTVILAWMGVIAYTFQIYYDFSGYSDMAIGLGAMFGFHFPENFDHPYLAKSITEFWRRWHISLSSWFRDYVYIPLGGNRKGTACTIFNLFVVWGLTGLWHGAGANFLLWGLYYWLLLVLEKYIWGKRLKRLPSVLQHIYAMFFVICGWALFAVEDFGKLKEYLAAMFYAGSCGFYNAECGFYLRSYAVLFLILIVGSTELPLKIFNKLLENEAVGNENSVITKIACKKNEVIAKADAEKHEASGKCRDNVAGPIAAILILIVMMLLSIAYVVAGTYNPFLYFRF